MTMMTFEEEERFRRDCQVQRHYDQRINSLEKKIETLFTLLKESQKEIEWASTEMRGREPDHWKDVRNKLKLVIEELEK